MKILFYNDFSSQIGGVEIFQSAIGEGLRSIGFEVCYVFGDNRKLLKNNLFFKTEMVVRSLLSNPSLEARLRSKIKAFNPDIIHINNNKLYTRAVLNAVRGSGAKVVSSFHDFHFSLEPDTQYNKNNLKHIWKRFLLKRIEEGSDVLLSYTHVVQQCLARAGVKEVSRLPLFVDDSRWVFKEDCHNNSPIILFFGRLEEQKGVFLLLESFRKVKESIPDAQLHYVGMGTSFDKLNNMINNSLQNKSIVLHGKKELVDLLQLLHSSRVSVVPSIWPEPFGLTGLESQSAGVPVVGAAIGGIPEWCIDGVSGLLFSAGDADSLSDKILQILKDADFSKKLSRTAKDFCQENFGFDEVLKTTAAFYKKMVK